MFLSQTFAVKFGLFKSCLGQIKVRTCLAREQPAESSQNGTKQVVASHFEL